MNHLKSIIISILLLTITVAGQSLRTAKQMQSALREAGIADKFMSGRLFRKFDERAGRLAKAAVLQNELLTVTLYFEEYPSAEQVQKLVSQSVTLYPATWTPPAAKHPLGFVLGRIPASNIVPILQNSFLKKIDDAESINQPLNNQAAKAIKADSVWSRGWTGTGIKIAILDSGLDSTSSNADLPLSYEKRDYSNYPTSIDSIVANTVTGHGTHVTGSVLGRGIYSASNTGNGGGAYKGMAYDASLVFLKIGSDASGSASDAAEIAAMHAAVDTFHAKLLSMSYGGWDAYHDGSSAAEQAVDWVIAQGVPFFLAAGNEGATNRHYSGTVNAHDSTGFIQVNISGAGTNNTALIFNLVWADGIGVHNGLSLAFYDNNHLPITDTTRLTTTESPRGTESQYSYYNQYLPAGSGTYYLRVINPSGTPQFFHLYDDWGNGCISFASPDPAYTIAQPASADSAFAVAAYTTRTVWTAADGSGYSYGNTLNDLCSFSSRGPRIDGVQKPDIASPGSTIISIRDQAFYHYTGPTWVDDDGTAGGAADYMVGQGTSMATPVCAGAAALLLNRFPLAKPAQIYSALHFAADADSYTGSLPNMNWGYGKLNINKAIDESVLPVELVTFNAVRRSDKVLLSWKTASEHNNYGFSIERRTGMKSGGTMIWNAWNVIGFSKGSGDASSPRDYSFTDKSAQSGNSYAYRLRQIDNSGSFAYSSIAEVGILPAGFALQQNYPNPFNPSTIISYSLPRESKVHLQVFDILGRVCRSLVEEVQPAGEHEVVFDAGSLSSGVYFSILRAEGFTATRKMLLVK
jgi:subtilisin family serine protease